MKLRIWGEDFDIQVEGITQVDDRSHSSYFRAFRDQDPKTSPSVKMPLDMIKEWSVESE